MLTSRQAIKEDRTVSREKYSELKLEAQFLKVSPGYLVATPQPLSSNKYNTNSALSITPVTGPNGSFWVIRHTDYASTASSAYSLMLTTSAGTVRVPQLGGSLTLNGRDSKIHVTDYPVGSFTLLYSTAEVFTWVKSQGKTTLLVYGGVGELHELAVEGMAPGSVLTGSGVTFKQTGGASVAQWQVSPQRKIITFGDLIVYLLGKFYSASLDGLESMPGKKLTKSKKFIKDRNSAYNYWMPDLDGGGQSSIIVNGPHLVRSASVNGSTLNIQADFNTTTTVEVIAVPSAVTNLALNGAAVTPITTPQGSWSVSIPYDRPDIRLPSLGDLNWMYIDSLPEIQPTYDDSAWPAADRAMTNNTVVQPFLTPVSLYGSDYGFHTGALIYRGHFTAQGTETKISITTQGGDAYASAAWLGSTFLGSFPGGGPGSSTNLYTLPKLTAGQKYIITIVVDNMGLDENWTVGAELMKKARGILSYSLYTGSSSVSQDGIKWKITGNLGGESYADQARGPLNEGGLFIERQGYHLPSPPLSNFTTGSPYKGITNAGLAFYTAEMPLNLPSGQYDIPLSFTFRSNNQARGTYRAWLYVNGYQFGRYANNLGPQSSFPVPEGILNYRGNNTIGLVIWAVTSSGANVPDFQLTAGTPVLTGRNPVQQAEMPAWSARAKAY